MKRLTITLLLVAACGDDGESPGNDAATKQDAAAKMDAAMADASLIDAMQFVFVESPCPAMPAESISAVDFNFVPDAVTISVNEVVQITTPNNHNVIPSPSMPTDPGLRVGFGETKCFKFTVAGEFNFICQPHGFNGKVTVTP